MSGGSGSLSENVLKQSFNRVLNCLIIIQIYAIVHKFPKPKTMPLLKLENFLVAVRK